MKKFDQINVIPFIDIMLVLLAIVLMTATFISQGKIKVDVPEAVTATRLSANDVAGYYITVTADGTYYLNDHRTSLDIIKQNVQQWQNDQPVTLKIDAKASFNHFVQLTDLLREKKMANIQVVTTPMQR